MKSNVVICPPSGESVVLATKKRGKSGKML